MSKEINNIKNLIQQYLSDEGILKEKISISDYDFGFIFSYPPGPKNQNMSVIKPKKSNFILIIIRIQISEERAKTLRSLKDNKSFQYFNTMRKYFLIKELYFKIDLQNFRYEIHKQIYPNSDGYISKNTFFKGILKVFYSYVFNNLLLDEYCSGKELSSTKFDPEFDLSLYS